MSFFLAAPSTIAIILSRKLSPASLVIRITIQSDNTVVPPVTALLSPPASRITGADSPVIALSSTDAKHLRLPHRHRGSVLPLFTITISPFFNVAEDTSVICSFLSAEGIFMCIYIFLEALKESACALPLPSAMASAKFANIYK